MKIQRYETGIVGLPREEGPLSGGSGDVAEFITIKIITDDGIEGIGYSGFASSIMVKALKETVDALLAEIVGEDPRRVEVPLSNAILSCEKENPRVAASRRIVR